MANILYQPDIPLSALDVTGLNPGDHLIFNNGSGEIEGTQDVDALTVQPILTANGAAVLNGFTPVDTSTTAITVTSPASPTANEEFGVSDGTANAAVNNITIDFGTDNFNGSVGTFKINRNGRGVMFSYVDTTIGWIVQS
jgi:hypothetical protein